MTIPTLIACSHGTDNPHGREVVSSLVAQTQRLLPAVDVIETYVDVQFPQVNEVLAQVPAGQSAVVVPLLLSGGYHVHHDIAMAVATRNNTGSETRQGATLGPHPLLAQVLRDRITESGGRGASAVVLVAAGSSDDRAQVDVERQADLLRQVVDAPVRIAYLSATTPSVPEVLSELHDQLHGQPQEAASIAIASYLLAPGFFQRKLHREVEEWLNSNPGTHLNISVSEPLGADPRIVQIIVAAYRAQVGVD